MPRGVKASKQTKRSSSKKSASKAPAALSLEKQIEAAVEELPTMLYREMQEKKPLRKTVTLPPAEAILANTKKRRFMVGAVSIFTLAIFAIWVFNARQLFAAAVNAPDTQNPFANSRENFSEMLDRMSQGDDEIMTALDAVSKQTAVEEIQSQQAAAAFAADMAGRLNSTSTATSTTATTTYTP